MECGREVQVEDIFREISAGSWYLKWWAWMRSLGENKEKKTSKDWDMRYSKKC